MTDTTQTSADETRSTQDAILDAAEAIVEREGARRLTIDAVVRESGFSKGGVLYNFGSKTALIQGMVERMIHSVDCEMEHALHTAESDGVPVLPALLCAAMGFRKKNSRLSMALLAAAAENPELIDPVRARVSETRTMIAKRARDPDLARIAFLASDGLHFADLLGLDFLTPPERDSVEERLIAMVSESQS
ncbi:TetR family transcriptional regulator [Marinicauda pacifica]|jgi:AcrR family transcriptional regulator|uniref:TetR/AcrR family transcriptional regulator n=1 Tax=Marinicauda pacifica TaxID=1133559 RepID=A0A4S2H8R6_9PROT|nr:MULTISPECIES: TetR/AcrR family transcriptional regulator [Marinicauda]TGY92227.1 TetR/AcrR family transcriptional regulator [Marinicauda pacifica]GGE47093.1 TetR family transcriptional regulator [Marinicauda pacifica]